VRASLPPQQRMEKQQESKYLEFEADEAGRDQLRTPQKSNASPSLPGRSQQEGGPFPQLPVLIATSKGKMLGTRPHPAVSESCSMYRSSDAPAPCVFNSNFQGEERFLGCCSASAHVSTCAHPIQRVFSGPTCHRDEGAFAPTVSRQSKVIKKTVTVRLSCSSIVQHAPPNLTVLPTWSIYVPCLKSRKTTARYKMSVRIIKCAQRRRRAHYFSEAVS
jgi:hypothetical protein